MRHRGSDTRGDAATSIRWPAYGQAAFIETGQSQVQAGPNQHTAAIASVAKVMTAYVVLRDHPLSAGEGGPTITLTHADAADTDRMRRRGESIVSVAAGEQLTELQALQALLLPSANNIAAALARWDAGSTGRFVARMNATARSLGMAHTRYADPSGYDAATVSTAADQVRVADRAMSLPVFAGIVATPRATLPVTGTVRNTNRLLGDDGFVGIKTGNTNTAGGCFAFRAIRVIDGKQTTITGVVLGQPGSDQVEAGLAAADAMVNRIAGQRPVGGFTAINLGPRSSASSGARISASDARSATNRVRCSQHTSGEAMKRTRLPLAALALLAVVAAGCGSGSVPPGNGNTSNSAAKTPAGVSGSNGTTTRRQKAVRFAECMRNNGIGAFPDPDASGRLTIDAVANGSSIDTSSAAFTQALGACKGLEPSGFTGARVTPPQRTARLEFARCIRKNGVPDFPDPTQDGPLVDTNRIPSAATPAGMSALNAAMHTCSRFGAAAGVSGGQ